MFEQGKFYKNEDLIIHVVGKVETFKYGEVTLVETVNFVSNDFFPAEFLDDSEEGWEETDSKEFVHTMTELMNREHFSNLYDDDEEDVEDEEDLLVLRIKSEDERSIDSIIEEILEKFDCVPVDVSQKNADLENAFYVGFFIEEADFDCENFKKNIEDFIKEKGFNVQVDIIEEFIEEKEEVTE